MIDALLRLLAPHECLGCNSEGSVLCVACRSSLLAPPAYCYRCLRPVAGGAICLACRPQTPLNAVYAATHYQGVAKDIIWKLKFAGAQAAVKELATVMAPLLPAEGDFILVHAPTATSHVRQRGYDQALLLARAVAKRSDQHQVPLLARHGQTHQVGANRQQRQAQLADAFRVRTPALARGSHIILVDDVLTTGATLEAAARALRAAGAARVDGLVFAQA